MSDKKVTNCGDCAFVQKDGNKLWCPFYDLPVSQKKVCKNFVDFFNAPNNVNLFRGTEPTPVAQFLTKDKIALGITAICILAGIGISIWVILALGIF